MKLVDIRNRLQQAFSSRNANSNSAKKPKDESLAGCDFTDIYTKLEEENPAKMGSLIGKLDNELLNDTLEYANRRLENLQNQSGEDARKEIEVGPPCQLTLRSVSLIHNGCSACTGTLSASSRERIHHCQMRRFACAKYERGQRLCLERL